MEEAFRKKEKVPGEFQVIVQGGLVWHVICRLVAAKMEKSMENYLLAIHSSGNRGKWRDKK